MVAAVSTEMTMLGYRHVLPLAGALGLVYLGLGVLFVAIPVSLHAAGVGPFGIGVIAAMYGAGWLAALVMAQRVMDVLGTVRTFFMAAALAGVFTLMISGLANGPLVGVLRLAAGASIGLLLTSGESWLSSVVQPEHRARVLWGYVAGMLGMAVVGVLLTSGLTTSTLLTLDMGEGLLGGATEAMEGAGDLALALPTLSLGVLLPGAFALAGGAFALAIVPAAFSNSPEEDMVLPKPLGSVFLTTLSPAAFLGVVVSGVTFGGVLALAGAFVALRQEPDWAGVVDHAAGLVAAIFIGAGFGLLPVSWAAKSGDRRVIIGGLAAASGVSAFLLAVTPLAVVPLVVTLAAVWGATTFGTLVVSMMHGLARGEHGGDRTRVVAGFVVVFAAGAVAGPLAGGLAAAIPLVNEFGLFVLVAALQGGLALFMYHRRAVRQPDGFDTAAMGFVPFMPSSVAMALLDPGDDRDEDMLVAEAEPDDSDGDGYGDDWVADTDDEVAADAADDSGPDDSGPDDDTAGDAGLEDAPRAFLSADDVAGAEQEARRVWDDDGSSDGAGDDDVSPLGPRSGGDGTGS